MKVKSIEFHTLPPAVQRLRDGIHKLPKDEVFYSDELVLKLSSSRSVLSILLRVHPEFCVVWHHKAHIGHPEAVREFKRRQEASER